MEVKSVHAKTFFSIPEDIADITELSIFDGVKHYDSMLFDTQNDLSSGHALQNKRTFTHDIELSPEVP